MFPRPFIPVFVHGLGALERLLPPAILAGVLWPGVGAFALCATFGKAGRARRSAFAAAYGTPLKMRMTVRAFIGETFGRLVTLWPDRFKAPRWQRRFTVTGLDQLLACRAEGRPIVFAIIHSQHMNLLRLFLRARGLPVASLTYTPGETAIRRLINAAADQCSPLAGTPHKFSLKQLRSAYDFLRSGNCLLIACDKHSDDMISLPTDLGTIGIHLGQFRLAAMANALVVPALVWQAKPWKFHVALGEPTVPPSHSSERSAFKPLADHCLMTWQVMIREHPEQLHPMRGIWNVHSEQAQPPPAGVSGLLADT